MSFKGFRLCCGKKLSDFSLNWGIEIPVCVCVCAVTMGVLGLWHWGKSGNFCTSLAVFITHFPGGPIQPSKCSEERAGSEASPPKWPFYAAKKVCVAYCTQVVRECAHGGGRTSIVWEQCREFKLLTEDEATGSRTYIWGDASYKKANERLISFSLKKSSSLLSFEFSPPLTKKNTAFSNGADGGWIIHGNTGKVSSCCSSIKIIP